MTTGQWSLVILFCATILYALYQLTRLLIVKPSTEKSLASDEDQNVGAAVSNQNLSQGPQSGYSATKLEEDLIAAPKEKEIAETIASLARYAIPDAEVSTNLSIENGLPPGWDVRIKHPEGGSYIIFVGGREGVLFYEQVEGDEDHTMIDIAPPSELVDTIVNVVHKRKPESVTEQKDGAE